MKRYFEYAISWDILIVIIIGVLILLKKQFLTNSIGLPKINNLNNFIVSLITVSATLIGFLLTIITVIVTFKKNFEDIRTPISDNLTNDFVTETIFDKKIKKEEKFYGTEIHKKVIDVFINAAYEIGLVLIILLLIQFNILNFTIFYISILSIISLLLIILTLLRSFYIFKLFLNVHIHDKNK